MKILLALSLTAGVAGFGVGVADASHSGPTAATPTAQGAFAAQSGPATISVDAATVLGQSERILVDSHGLPLYTYTLDTATQSQVSLGVARFWPALLSGSPTENGATGRLSVVTDAVGQQVQYNGHFLYTFVNDTPGQVTGQDVQGFVVATPLEPERGHVATCGGKHETSHVNPSLHTVEHRAGTSSVTSRT